MNQIASALRELWGLFVEDWTFTVAIVACLGIAVVAFPNLVAPVWRGPLLFGLLAIALIENCARVARRP